MALISASTAAGQPPHDVRVGRALESVRDDLEQPRPAVLDGDEAIQRQRC